MSEHRRTAIRKLVIQRYRSLKEVVLEDLPEIIVLFGPNGSGKSNILRAVQLVLRAAGRPGVFPMSRQDAVTLTLSEANTELDLRPDDFRHGDIPEIRVEIEIDLGQRALEMVLPPGGLGLSNLKLEGVFQLDDGAHRSVRYWFQSADLNDRVRLGEPSEPSDRGHRERVVHLRSDLNRLKADRQKDQSKLLDFEKMKLVVGTLSPERQSQQALAEMGLSRTNQAIREREDELRKTEASLSQESLVAERIQSRLIPRLLQTSDAYRVPGGEKDPQKELFQAFLSEDPKEREATHRLSRRLAQAALFGSLDDSVALSPVDSRTYGEKQIHVRHPIHGELPLRNLGSGEQQIVLMLAQRVITPFPIAQLEEPEAHLHKTLMEPLATLLLESVLGNDGAPDVDQLWMATHHHYFAIAEEYFDVSLDTVGQTMVRRRPRDEAAEHFYEPSPYWDTLRGLVKSGMSPDTTVSIDAHGQPIRAKDVIESLEGDQRLAREFVEAATKAFVLSLTEDGSEK